jgi:hypothetical protein
VRQSRRVNERIAIWLQAVRQFLDRIHESRIYELLDDGTLVPWREGATNSDPDAVPQLAPGALKVLGIDVASATWAANGSAVLAFDVTLQQVSHVYAPAITWPNTALTPRALATVIDNYARRNDIRAVAIDGPQGWRDPETPNGLPGVGRRCEFECRTQGKTGVYPHTFPASQRTWIEFCIAVFDELLQKDDVQLGQVDAARKPPEHGYVLLECYPTSAWRLSGLPSLPAKKSAPRLREYARRLAHAYSLPSTVCDVTSHDDLQAVIAALVASAAIGGPAIAIASGKPATTAIDPSGVSRRVEGLIWNVRPLSIKPPASTDPSGVSPSDLIPAVKVTTKVINQAARGVLNQQQIVLKHLPGGTSEHRTTIHLELDDEEYVLIVGDTHAAWRSHQDSRSADSFDRLFARLADTPDRWRSVTIRPTGPRDSETH